MWRKPFVSTQFKAITIGIICVLCLAIYAQNERLETAKSKLEDAINNNKAQAKLITEMSEQSEKMAELAKGYGEKLAGALNEIDNLSDSIDADTERVYIKADCPESVPAKPSTATRPDAASARLTKDAEKNYLRLRREIETTTNQVEGLQAYINALPSECVAQGGEDVR